MAFAESCRNILVLELASDKLGGRTTRVVRMPGNELITRRTMDWTVWDRGRYFALIEDLAVPDPRVYWAISSRQRSPSTPHSGS